VICFAVTAHHSLPQLHAISRFQRDAIPLLRSLLLSAVRPIQQKYFLNTPLAVEIVLTSLNSRFSFRLILEVMKQQARSETA
jgi:hypothetical protein